MFIRVAKALAKPEKDYGLSQRQVKKNRKSILPFYG
jgi:hypothetical protein